MNVTVTDVLGSLFNPTDTVCFRVFDDKKGGVFQGSKLSCECGKYKSIEETLKNHNAMYRGIFFVVNYGGQDDDSITRINAQFVEMDNDSFPAPSVHDHENAEILSCLLVHGFDRQGGAFPYDTDAACKAL